MVTEAGFSFALAPALLFVARCEVSVFVGSPEAAVGDVAGCGFGCSSRRLFLKGGGLSRQELTDIVHTNSNRKCTYFEPTDVVRAIESLCVWRWKYFGVAAL